MVPLSKSNSSLYEFGSSEAVVRNVQRRFVPYFNGAGPVLDIGCGRGIFLQLLAQAGKQSVGIDCSDESLDFCRQKGFHAEKSDALTFLRSTNQRFGGIFCSHVIEHLPYEQADEMLQLCFRALSPEGVLLIVTPNPEDLAIISEIFWLDATHVRPYPALLLRSMLQTNGFDVTDVRQFLGDWRMIGRRRMPGYVWRRLILGKHYGKPNTLVVARKPPDAASQDPKR